MQLLCLLKPNGCLLIAAVELAITVRVLATAVLTVTRLQLASLLIVWFMMIPTVITASLSACKGVAVQTQRGQGRLILLELL